MYLFQILVPVNTEVGQGPLDQISAELKEKFGGVTSYSRAPAEGLWEKSEAQTVKDAIVVVEVMTESKDNEWWMNYRNALEKRLSQEEIVIRVIETERI